MNDTTFWLKIKNIFIFFKNKIDIFVLKNNQKRSPSFPTHDQILFS